MCTWLSSLTPRRPMSWLSSICVSLCVSCPGCRHSAFPVPAVATLRFMSWLLRLCASCPGCRQLYCMSCPGCRHSTSHILAVVTLRRFMPCLAVVSSLCVSCLIRRFLSSHGRPPFRCVFALSRCRSVHVIDVPCLLIILPPRQSLRAFALETCIFFPTNFRPVLDLTIVLPSLGPRHPTQ